MTDLSMDGLPRQLLAFVDTLGPLLVLAGTFEAFAAFSRQASNPRHGGVVSIWHRYMRWLLAGLALSIAAGVMTVAIGRGSAS